jgi:hypothetical protein
LKLLIDLDPAVVDETSFSANSALIDELLQGNDDDGSGNGNGDIDNDDKTRKKQASETAAVMNAVTKFTYYFNLCRLVSVYI